MRRTRLKLLLFALGVGVAYGRQWSSAPDLNAVHFRRKPHCKPVVLVSEGKPMADIIVADRKFALPARELQTHIELATGARLPIKKGKPERTSIILGDEEVAGANGIRIGRLPAEGFEIKTFDGG